MTGLHPKKILVIAPSWVGDTVMAHSLFQTLVRNAPDVTIGVVASGWSKGLLERMPEVKTVYSQAVGHGQLGLRTRWQTARQIREDHYDSAIVLPGSLKSALIPWFARIPTRTGWLGEQRYGFLNDWRRLDKPRLPRIVDRYVALAYPPGAFKQDQAEVPRPRLPSSDAAQAKVLVRLGLTKLQPVLALCPGAEFGSSKQWPAEKYGALAQKLISQGAQVWVLGSEKDQPVAEAVYAATGRSAHCHVLAGKTSLLDAVDLLAQADWVVSNDSGLMHIAAAVDARLVAIYGATVPSTAPPLTETAQVVWRALECQPCHKRRCPLGHFDCLNGLSVEEVSAALGRLDAK